MDNDKWINRSLKAFTSLICRLSYSQLLIHLIEHYIQAAAVPSTDAADVSSGKYNRRKYSQGKYKPTDEGNCSLIEWLMWFQQ